jgi:hypothetical protein
MQAMLADEFQLTPKYCQQSSVISPLPAKASEIDLFEISTVAYGLLSKKKNHETFAASLVSRNTNDRGQFVVIKTRLTTKRKEKCKKREDYIYVVRS